MAETTRMTAEEVVSQLLSDKHADLVRDSLRWMVQLMEAEVSEPGTARRG